VAVGDRPALRGVDGLLDPDSPLDRDVAIGWRLALDAQAAPARLPEQARLARAGAGQDPDVAPGLVAVPHGDQPGPAPAVRDGQHPDVEVGQECLPLLDAHGQRRRPGHDTASRRNPDWARLAWSATWIGNAVKPWTASVYT